MIFHIPVFQMTKSVQSSLDGGGFKIFRIFLSRCPELRVSTVIPSKKEIVLVTCHEQRKIPIRAIKDFTFLWTG